MIARQGAVAPMSGAGTGGAAAWREAVDRLQELLRGTLGHNGEIPLHSPTFGPEDWVPVKDCLDSGWVSSVGSYVDRFEREVAAACGAVHGIATVNGTAALHAALTALEIGPGDAVICPALTFIATANAISYCGAQPIFMDVDTRHFGLSPAAFESFLAQHCAAGPRGPVDQTTGLRVAAIVAVHLFGHPVDVDALRAITDRHGIAFVEDAAEALGSLYRGQACGSLGRVGVLSFNGNKTVTTGGGGMTVTNDAALAARLKHVTTTARTPHAYEFDHDTIGFNYRLPNLNAALGCAQMSRLTSLIERKRRMAALYKETFAGIEGIEFIAEAPWARSNYWLNSLLLPDRESRDAFLDATNAMKMQTRPGWRLLPETAAYRGARLADGLVAAKAIHDRLVNIPSSSWLVPE